VLGYNRLQLRIYSALYCVSYRKDYQARRFWACACRNFGGHDVHLAEIITGNRRQFMHCGSQYGSYPIGVNGGMTTMYKGMYIAVIYGVYKRWHDGILILH
jgi:hypothetical protein